MNNLLSSPLLNFFFICLCTLKPISKASHLSGFCIFSINFSLQYFVNLSVCLLLVGTEIVLVDEIPFPAQITTTKPLSLLGHGKFLFSVGFIFCIFSLVWFGWKLENFVYWFGEKKEKKRNGKFLIGGYIYIKIGITDIEIHFLQIKFTAIGVYLEPEIVEHLQQWKGKQGSELADDDDFFEAVISGKKTYNNLLYKK